MRPGMRERGSPRTPLGSERREGKKKKKKKSERGRKITSAPGPPARLPLAPSHEQSPRHALQHRAGLIRSGGGGGGGRGAAPCPPPGASLLSSGHRRGGSAARTPDPARGRPAALTQLFYLPLRPPRSSRRPPMPSGCSGRGCPAVGSGPLRHQRPGGCRPQPCGPPGACPGCG